MKPTKNYRNWQRKNLPEEYKKATQLNKPVKYKCPECEDHKERLYVTRIRKACGTEGWLYHCHNCVPKMSGFAAKKQGEKEPITTVLDRYRERQETSDENVPVFPRDAHFSIPAGFINWLEQYNIKRKEILKYGIQYSPSLDSLLFPVFDDKDELVFWQERDANKKIKSRVVPGYKPIDRHLHIDNGDTLVIVEDYISTIKVGRVYSSVCLWGSTIPSHILDLARGYKNVIIWLDEDKYQDAIDYCTRMRQFGINAYVISTVDDPKWFFEEEVCDLIEAQIREDDELNELRDMSCPKCGADMVAGFCANEECPHFYQQCVDGF